MMQLARTGCSRQCVYGARSVWRSVGVGGKITVPFTATHQPNAQLQADTSHPKKRSCSCNSVLSPIFGLVFNPILLGILWAIGATRFWNNYSRTTYTADKKALLTALWPALWVANGAYRAQFKNAVRGD